MMTYSDFIVNTNLSKWNEEEIQNCIADLNSELKNRRYDKCNEEFRNKIWGILCEYADFQEEYNALYGIPIGYSEEDEDGDYPIFLSDIVKWFSPHSLK